MKIEPSLKKISMTYLISMTDVVFLLIIFLLIASNFVTQTGLPVKLPGSSSGIQQSGEMVDVIYVSPTQITLNGFEMNIVQFQEKLPSLFLSEKQVVRIFSDKTTSVQEIIGMMDIIRNVGFERIFIATEKRKEIATE